MCTWFLVWLSSVLVGLLSIDYIQPRRRLAYAQAWLLGWALAAMIVAAIEV